MKAFIRIAGFFLLLITFPIFSASLYVQSPLAKLLVDASITSAGKPLKSGTQVSQIGEKDMFFKVKSDEGEGWVLKIYVSNVPPSAKVNLSGVVDKSTSVKSRARASDFSQTAAARGLTESKSLRTRGSSADYDFESVDWLDNIKVSEKEMEDFRKE